MSPKEKAARKAKIITYATYILAPFSIGGMAWVIYDLVTGK